MNTTELTEKYNKYADKIDDAKIRGAIGDMSVVAYEILREWLTLQPKPCNHDYVRGNGDNIICMHCKAILPPFNTTTQGG